MHALVRTVFSRLHSLNAETAEAKLLAGDDETAEGEIKMTVSTNQINPDEAEIQVLTVEEKSEDNDASMSPSSTMTARRAECGLYSIYVLYLY